MCNKICAHLELFGFRPGAARWNEKIRIDPAKLPPRASADEPRCRWGIKMTDKRVDYAAKPGEYGEKHGPARDGRRDREPRGREVLEEVAVNVPDGRPAAISPPISRVQRY